MAENLQFYYSLDAIPDPIKNGNIYFILDKENNIGNIKVDLENQRYDIKPKYSDATTNEHGLMSAEDKRKLIPFSIVKESNDKIQINNALDNHGFNFLKDIFVNSSQVLTENSFAQVEVKPVKKGEDPEQPNNIEIVKYVDDNGQIKHKLKLILNLPEGPEGSEGKEGAQGRPGKEAIINEIKASIDNNIEGTPTVEVITTKNENELQNVTNLDFHFTNLKGKQGNEGKEGPRGPQGFVYPVEFNFISGQSVETTKTEVHYDDDQSKPIEKIVYQVTIPPGLRGDSGKPFRISRQYYSYEEMLEAFNKPSIINGEENPEGIPLDSFIIIISNPEGSSTDPMIGNLYYRSFRATDTKPIFITDMSPTQPEFFIEKTNTLNSDQNAFVTINSEEIAKPKLTFNIPRGKQLKAGTFTGTIDKNFGTPVIEGTLTESGPIDNKQLDLNLNLKNLGTLTPIEVGNVTTDNTISNTPKVTINSRQSADHTVQLLDFDFKGFKGQKGDAANSFDTSDTGITAEYISDPENPSPRANVSAITKDDGIQLKFNFYNLKGEDGALKRVSYTGEGNAVTSINIDNTGENYLIANRSTIFASQEEASNADNITSGTIKVNVGGTGLTKIPFNSLIAGNGTDPVQFITNGSGALYSDGDNLPKFGVLPTSLGGTGKSGLLINSVLVGDGVNSVKNIQSSSGAFYAIGNSQTPQFGTLPIPQGGTGLTKVTNNSVVVAEDSQYNFINYNIGAFYTLQSDVSPRFGLLPIAIGGTNATNKDDACQNLGATQTVLSLGAGEGDPARLEFKNVTVSGNSSDIPSGDSGTWGTTITEFLEKIFKVESSIDFADTNVLTIKDQTL